MLTSTKKQNTSYTIKYHLSYKMNTNQYACKIACSIICEEEINISGYLNASIFINAFYDV